MFPSSSIKLQATFELLVSLLFNQQEHFTYSYPLWSTCTFMFRTQLPLYILYESSFRRFLNLSRSKSADDNMYVCTVTCSIEGRDDKSSVHLEREESVIFGKIRSFPLYFTVRLSVNVGMITLYSGRLASDTDLANCRRCWTGMSFSIIPFALRNSVRSSIDHLSISCSTMKKNHITRAHQINKINK